MSSRSKRSRAESLSPALFPFLAVLVCTMGALVLILVIVVSQASASAKQTVQMEEDALLEQSDLVEVASEEMKAQRQKQQEAINNRRAQLAGIEDHINRLIDELNTIKETKAAIEQQATQTEQERNAQAQRMLELEQQIQTAQEELVEARSKAEKSKPAFAILPYQGKHGTTRRPIYIECTQGGVIIQPEGVMISIEDLKPPHGPGNPLDASLRLIRSTFQKLDPSASSMVSPYPLLLVRPDGIKSYVLARAAMNGWDDQFGYELIDQNMPLAFPPSIPGLSRQLVENLEISRQRQTALIAAMPRRYSKEYEWDEALDSIDQDLQDNDKGSGSRSRLAAGKDWSAIDSEIAKEVGEAPWKMVAELPNAPAQGGIAATAGNMPPRREPASTTSQQGSPATNGSLPSRQDLLSMQQASRDGLLESQTASHGTQPNATTDVWQDPASGELPDRGNEGSQPFASNATNASNQIAPSNSIGSQGGSPNLFSQANPSNQEMAQGTTPSSEQNPGDQSPNIDLSPRRSSQRSSGESKKATSAPVRTWTTTHRHVNGTMVTRPMTIVAMSDRWLIMRDNAPTQVESTIPLNMGPSAAGQQLEKAINERVESWGIAVANGYWQPKLTIQFAPDAGISVQRLRKILDGSGLDAELQPLR